MCRMAPVICFIKMGDGIWSRGKSDGIYNSNGRVDEIRDLEDDPQIDPKDEIEPGNSILSSCIANRTIYSTVFAHN